MRKIAIIGGHGKVALHLARQLSERGDEVTSFFRNPDHSADVSETGAKAVVLDIEQADVDSLAQVLSGHDAVVWSAGAGGGNPDRTRAVDRDAAIASMDAAAKAGVFRYVMVSYRGAGKDETPADSPFKAYADAKAAADAHLRSSGLQWTIVAPGGLDLEPGVGTIHVDRDYDRSNDKTSVSREDVAAVVAATLADETTIGSTIEFVGGGTPIAEAITAS
ncbi:NAD(P)H-binding protein [Ornithinimicrobium faecis]|uniref:NAD(P)H-binding protein n=1 Tax=Ornithinimicrobium faecis TaxID=2934158 RepID=A0ABY4YXU7_9MICO|nr:MULTISPECIES: NAD(P)H-binding protein [unclassified Ornithinimicrobium]USQ81609.1 NAD(P)H-binding protein [Ornithinimicrobium sp. HY1793]